MLSDGATLRQAAHQAHVSLQTALLWKRKMQRIPENAGNTVLSGEVWVDHTYINAPMSVRKGKKRRGLSRHLLQVGPASTPAAMCFSGSEAGDWQGQGILGMLFSDI